MIWQNDATGQVDAPMRLMPTYQGLRHYVLRLADGEMDNAALWNRADVGLKPMPFGNSESTSHKS